MTANSLGQDAPEPDPPEGFRPMKDAPPDGRVVIIAHRDGVKDAKNEIDYDVMLARMSTTAPYVAWMPIYLDPDDPSACNHGAIAYPIGWLPIGERRR